MRNNYRFDTLLLIVLLCVSILMIVLGSLAAYLSSIEQKFFIGNQTGIVFLSIGTSIFASLVIEILSYFKKRDLIDEIRGFKQILKSSEDWGLIDIVHSRWDGFYNEFDKSKEVRYLSFNSRGIFSPITENRSKIVDFLFRGGYLKVVILDRNSPSFNVRKNDWDEKSQWFEAQMDQVNENIIRVLEELKARSCVSNFRLEVKCTSRFMYNNVVIFDKRLYHYTPNSNSWTVADGFSLHTRFGSKLAIMLENLFDKNFSKSPYHKLKLKSGKELNIKIDRNNLSEVINKYYSDKTLK